MNKRKMVEAVEVPREPVPITEQLEEEIHSEERGASMPIQSN